MKNERDGVVYEVESYTDQIKLRTGKRAHEIRDGVRRNFFGMPLAEHWFNTEAEAAEFIINRASKGVDAAKVAAKRAEERLKKCRKKFGPLTEPEAAKRS